MGYVSDRLETAIHIVAGIITKENITDDQLSLMGWHKIDDDTIYGFTVDERWERIRLEACEILHNRLSKLSGD